MEKGKRQTQRQASLQHSQKSNYIYGQEGKTSREAGSNSQTSQQKHIETDKSNIYQAGLREEVALAGTRRYKQQTKTVLSICQGRYTGDEVNETD